MVEPIAAVPLTETAFAPFGDVIAAPADLGRRSYFEGLVGGGAGAAAELGAVKVAPRSDPLLSVDALERHPFSSQTFLPLNAGRWLVIVAPPDASGLPDVDQVCAFVVGPDTGITYHRGVWHHPLVALDQVADFAVLMWKRGDGSDDEWADVDRFEVTIPGCDR